MIWLFVLLGLIVGAMVNMAADALPRGLPVGRRVCSCGARLPWRYTLSLPWHLWSSRQCVHCQSQLSPRPVIVELSVAALFGYAWLHFGPGVQLWVTSAYIALLALIFVIDIEHRRVMNKVLLPSALLVLAISGVAAPFSPAGGLSGVVNALLGGVIGLGVFLLIALAKPEAMGMGDVKLAGLIGLITGAPGVVVALVLAIVFGGIGALVLWIGRRVSHRDHIPYAPFLALGCLAAIFYGGQIWTWYTGRLNIL